MVSDANQKTKIIMAVQDSYVTGVGEYPVAPNTSVDAFLSTFPEYDTQRYRKLLMQESPKWLTDEKDWNFIRSKYDSWYTDLNNQHLATVERWKTKYQTPLNQSELLEAAGYNRNWLQGASGSMPDVQPVDPGIHDAGVNQFDPADQVMQGLQALTAALGQAAQISDVMASRDLKQAQADRINMSLPFDLSRKYFPILEKAKEHGYLSPEDEFYHFTPVAGQGVDLYNGVRGSYFDSVMGLNKDIMTLRKGSLKLSNDQKQWIISTMNPINERIALLQEELLKGTKTLQDYNVELEGIIQPLKKIYIPKGMKQNYWLTYVTAAANLAAQIGGLIAQFKGLGLKQDMFDFTKGQSWFEDTGEITPAILP